MKQCIRCKETKPLMDFKTDKRRRNGKTSYCKCCNALILKAWRLANPEKVKLDNKRKKNNHSPSRIEAKRRWRSKNLEHLRLKARAWRAANRQLCRAIDKKWREANPEKARLKNRIKESRRRARLARVGGNHTGAQINKMLIAQKFKCANCHI